MIPNWMENTKSGRRKRVFIFSISVFYITKGKGTGAIGLRILKKKDFVESGLNFPISLVITASPFLLDTEASSETKQGLFQV